MSSKILILDRSALIIGKLRVWLLIVLALSLIVSAGCGGSGGGRESHIVHIRYTREAERGIPRGISSVAVLPAALGPATDPKWSDLASNTLQRLLWEANDRHDLNLQVVARKELPKIMAEADLAAAGMTPSAQPGAPVQVESIQAFITSQVDVLVEERVGRSKTISGLDLSGLGGRNSRDPRDPRYRRSKQQVGVRTKEVDTIVRHMTVHTSFKLIDSATGREWESFTDTAEGTEEDKPSLFFGSDSTAADLTPTDKVIGSLVEVAARKFVQRLFPTDVEAVIKLKSSGHESCQAGVRALRAELFEEALVQFQAAIAEDSEDHRALFGAGVTCELLGDLEQAVGFYRRAVLIKDEEAYLAALKRLTGHPAKSDQEDG